MHSCEACVALGRPQQLEAATQDLGPKTSRIKSAKNPPQAQVSTVAAPHEATDFAQATT